MSPHLLSGSSDSLRLRPADRVRMARRIEAVRRSGGTVLEIGCSDPGVLAWIGGARVAVAPTEDGAARVRMPGLPAVAGKTESLGFADQVFDVVVVSRVMHLVDDTGSAARELFRVTRPGGTVIIEIPGRDQSLERWARSLDTAAPLRRYLQFLRPAAVAALVRTFEKLGCAVRSTRLSLSEDTQLRWSKAVAASSGYAAPPRPCVSPGMILTVRVPGLRRGRMPVKVHGLPGWNERRVRELLGGLPQALGYTVIVKPLRYRTRPHVQAFCEFEQRRILIQVPVPFKPFFEDVPYRAKRLRAKGFAFRWQTRRLRFEEPGLLIRYLYLHEYYHWWLREVMGKTSAAETACDRFALQRL